MSQTEKKRLGDVLFQDIDDNDYLNELYKNILYNYAITILQITNIKQLRGINVDDALRFADIFHNDTMTVATFPSSTYSISSPAGQRFRQCAAEGFGF